MTDAGTELMRKLVILGAQERATVGHAVVATAFMGAAIAVGLGPMTHNELSDWLRRLADDIDNVAAQRKPS